MSNVVSNDEWRYYLDKSFSEISLPKGSSEKTIKVIQAVCRYCMSICAEQEWFDGSLFDDMNIIVDNLADQSYELMNINLRKDVFRWNGGPMRVMCTIISNAFKSVFDKTYKYEKVNKLTMAEMIAFLVTYCGLNFREAFASVSEIIAVGYSK